MMHAHKLKIDGFSKIIKQKIVTPESSFVYFLLLEIYWEREILDFHGEI